VFVIAGWSSPVARQAHNLKAVGSNPTPATNLEIPDLFNANQGFFMGQWSGYVNIA
jgi:hypothetical protein